MAEKPTYVAPEKAKYEFDKSFTFRLRRISSGNFASLWELARLNRVGGVEKIISDADALPYCVENLMGELEAEGF